MIPKSKHSLPPEAVSKEKLAGYVYEYLIHVGAQKAAAQFLTEVQCEKQFEVGESPGFLLQWWCVFFDLYCAAPERNEACEHTSEAKAFHDYGGMTPYGVGIPPGLLNPSFPPDANLMQVQRANFFQGPRGQLAPCLSFAQRLPMNRIPYPPNHPHHALLARMVNSGALHPSMVARAAAGMMANDMPPLSVGNHPDFSPNGPLQPPFYMKSPPSISPYPQMYNAMMAANPHLGPQSLPSQMPMPSVAELNAHFRMAGCNPMNMNPYTSVASPFSNSSLPSHLDNNTSILNSMNCLPQQMRMSPVNNENNRQPMTSIQSGLNRPSACSSVSTQIMSPMSQGGSIPQVPSPFAPPPSGANNGPIGFQVSAMTFHPQAPSPRSLGAGNVTPSNSMSCSLQEMDTVAIMKLKEQMQHDVKSYDNNFKQMEYFPSQ